MLRSIVFGIIFSLVTISTYSTSYSAVENSQIGGQVFKGQIEINASADKVWAVLTDLKTFTQAIGFEFISGKEKVGTVGDTARIKVWADETTYILTYLDTNKELRFALEPDNASYICQKNGYLSQAATKQYSN